MVNIGTPAGVCHCRHSVLVCETRIPGSLGLFARLGTVCADHGYSLQRLHDVQTGLDQLGAADHWLFIGMVVYFTYSRHIAKYRHGEFAPLAMCS